MKQIRTLFIFAISFLLLILPSSCSREKIKSIEEYVKWINLKDNGLIKEKSVNGIVMKVKYLPPQYLAYMDSRGLEASNKQLDSISTHYKNSLTFVLSLQPDEKKGNHGDLVYYGVSEYKDYAERMITMNFDMEQYVSLQIEQKEYSPILSSMENTYGLSETKNLIFVFMPGDTINGVFNGDELDFTYNGEMFDVGINHFVFKKEDIENAPELAID